MMTCLGSLVGLRLAMWVHLLLYDDGLYGSGSCWFTNHDERPCFFHDSLKAGSCWLSAAPHS